MKILHVITGLERGGAEAMLAKLVAASERHDHHVLSLRGIGPVGRQMARAGISVSALDLDRLPRTLTVIPRLRRIMRELRPDIIQGWMDHGNFMALVARGLAPANPPLLWNIRRSLDSSAWDKGLSRRLLRWNARLSTRPDFIIYNSEAGARQHEAIGYDPEKRRVLPNGFDMGRYDPPAAARRTVRRDLGVADDELLIGLVARYHPCKNHHGFFRAAAAAQASGARMRLLFVGAGMSPDNIEVADTLRQLGLLDRALLLGERDDVPRLTAAFDIACNVSHGEGFPNVVGEAMAAGVPCLVTDVGDCRIIVGDTGLVCDGTDAEAIGRGLLRLMEMDDEQRRRLGRRARERIGQHYSLPAIARRYDALYEEAGAVGPVTGD